MTQVYRFNDQYGDFEIRADNDWEATAQAAVIRADRAATWNFVDSGEPMPEEHKAEMIRKSGERCEALKKHIAYLDDTPRRREVARQAAIDIAIEFGYVEPVGGGAKRQTDTRPPRDDLGGFIGSPAFVLLAAATPFICLVLYALIKAQQVTP